MFEVASVSDYAKAYSPTNQLLKCCVLQIYDMNIK